MRKYDTNAYWGAYFKKNRPITLNIVKVIYKSQGKPEELLQIEEYLRDMTTNTMCDLRLSLLLGQLAKHEGNIHWVIGYQWSTQSQMAQGEKVLCIILLNFCII